MLPIVLAILLAQGGAPDRKIYFGDGYMFRVELPEGWKSAPDKAKALKVIDVLERDGSTITLSSHAKKLSERAPVEKVIDKVLADLKLEVPNSKARVGAEITTLVGQKAYVFFVEPPADKGVRKCIAFLNTPKVAISMLLRAPTPEAYNESLTGYVPLLKSFGFVTDKVKVRSK